MKGTKNAGLPLKNFSLATQFNLHAKDWVLLLGRRAWAVWGLGAGRGGLEEGRGEKTAICPAWCPLPWHDTRFLRQPAQLNLCVLAS
jgi:hypothetical protein